jgi:DNA modification methylase
VTVDDGRTAALGLRLVSLDELRPHPENPKGHDIPTIREGMRRHGFNVPVLVCERTGYIAAGHGRRLTLLAMRGDHEPPPRLIELGPAGEWMVPVVTGWSSADDAELLAEVVGDNETTIRGGWIENILGPVLAQISQTPLGFEGTGFSTEELNRILAKAPPGSHKDPDAIPERQEVAITKRGDLWELGPHRIICGDSTDAEVVDTLFWTAPKATLIFTDPPYGQSYESAVHGSIAGDDKRRDDLLALVAGALGQAVLHSSDQAAFYIWHATQSRDDFVWAMRKSGLEELETIVWVKPSATLGMGDYRRSHEPCFYATKEGATPSFYGDRTGESVWRFAATGQAGRGITAGKGVVISDGEGDEVFVTRKVPKRKVRHVRAAGEAIFIVDEPGTDGTVWEVSRETELYHATQKPVELATRAILNSSGTGEVVYDPFAGSGTTIIGAQLTGRRGFGVELSPHNVDVIARRWQTLTGEAPRRAGQPVDLSN